MNCDKAQDLMASYVNGTLQADRQQLVADHLGGCAPCRQWRDEVQAAWHMWQTDDAPPAPDLVSVVMANLPPRPIHRPTAARLALVHYGVAASITLLLFSAGFFDVLGSEALQLNETLSSALQLLLEVVGNGSGM